MPIDPSIALSYRPPQIDNPIEIMGRIQALKNQGLQQQALQQNIQGAQLENQQRMMALQDDLNSRKAYMESGGDLDLYQKKLGEYGVSPQTITKIQQGIVDAKTKVAQLDEKTLDVHQKRNDQLRGMFQAVLDAPEEQRPLLWQTTVGSAQTRGLLTPDMQIPVQYPGADGLRAVTNTLATGSQLTKEEYERRRAAAAESRANTAAGEAKAKTEEKTFLGAISNVATAQSADEYKKKLDLLPHGVAQRLIEAVPPERFDPKTSPATLRRLGMTPEQQAQEAQRAETEARLKKSTEDLEAHRKVLERQGRTQTETSKAIDRRQAERDLDQFAKDESTANRTRKQLGNAIGSGTVFVDKNGYVKPMEKVLQDYAEEGQATTREALIQDMRERYGQATDDLRRTIQRKNDTLAGLGRKVGVSTEEAHRRIDEGDRKLKLASPAKPPEQPTAPAAQPAAGQQPATAAPAQPRRWNIGGQIYTEGQEFINAKDKKRYRITGVVNGKIKAVPVQ